MLDYLKGKNVRIRCKKPYPTAHTHIIIGRVEEENSSYLVVKGKTFHFNRIIDGIKSQVHSGEVMIRIVPWNNIEIIHALSEKTNWNSNFSFDINGNLVLDDHIKTVIAEYRTGME